MDGNERMGVGIDAAGLAGIRQRLRERYPDEQPADDAAWEGLNSRYMDETDMEIGKYKDAESKMTELCQVYPEFAELVYNMLEGKMPFRAAVAKLFSEEDLIPQDDDEDYEAYSKAYGERLENLKKRDSQTREIEQNEAQSLQNIDKFCAEKGLPDDRKDQLIGLINDHFSELLYKRISPEMLEGFLKQMSYDTAVAEAEKTGEIRGKNANIEARRIKENQTMAGDGVPGATGGGSFSQSQKPRSRSFFDLPERKGI